MAQSRQGWVEKRSRFNIRWNDRYLVADGVDIRLYNEPNNVLKRSMSVVTAISIPSSFWSSRHLFAIYDATGACLELSCSALVDRDAWIEYFAAAIERAKLPPPAPAVRAAAARRASMASVPTTNSRSSSARTSLAPVQTEPAIESTDAVPFVAKSRARMSMIASLSGSSLSASPPASPVHATEPVEPVAAAVPEIPVAESATLQQQFETAVAELCATPDAAHWLSLASVVRQFQERAVACAQRVIEEYALIDACKSIKMSPLHAQSEQPTKSHRRFSMVSSVEHVQDADHDVDWSRSQSRRKSQGGSVATHPEDAVYLVSDKTVGSLRLEFRHAWRDDVEDELQSKAAARELHATSATLTSMLETGQSRICFIYACVVDYMGFRVSVTSEIMNSLYQVYGWSSPDTFVTPIDCDQSKADMILQQVAAIFNLKAHKIFPSGHLVAITSSSNICLFQSPSHSYINFAAPPLPICMLTATDPAWRVRTFRSEFLRHWSVPLSADVFLDVAKPADGAVEADDEVHAVQAASFLAEKLVQSAAKALLTTAEPPLEGGELCSFLHERGIPLHLLGRITAAVLDEAENTSSLVDHTQNEINVSVADASFLLSASQLSPPLSPSLPGAHILSLCIVEIVARVCKRALKSNLRKVLRMMINSSTNQSAEAAVELQQALLEESREGIVDFFNLVLGPSNADMLNSSVSSVNSFSSVHNNSTDTDAFWQTVISRRIKKQFPGFPSRLRLHRAAVHSQRLFMRLQQLCGALFHARAEPYTFELRPFNASFHSLSSSMVSDGAEFNDAANIEPLCLDDLALVTPVCKSINLESALLSGSSFCTEALDSALDEQRWTDALQCLRQKSDALNLLAPTGPLPSLNWLQTRLQTADVLIKIRDLDGAREVVADVFQVAWYYPSALVGAYLIAARIEWAQGEPDTAEQNFGMAQQLAIDYFGDATPLLVDVELNAARFHSSYSDSKQALAHAVRARNIAAQIFTHAECDAVSQIDELVSSLVSADC